MSARETHDPVAIGAIGFSAFDYVPMGIFIIDREMTFTFWNAYLEDLTGIVRSLIIGKALTEVFPRFKDRQYQSRLETLFAGGPPIVLSPRFHRHLIPIELEKGVYQAQHIVARYLVDRSGRDLALFLIQDVTEIARQLEDHYRISEKAIAEAREREKAEKALKLANELLKKHAADLEMNNKIALSMMEDADRANHELEISLKRLEAANHRAREWAAKAEDANRAKTEFLANMSHELKTPMNAILGFAEMLRDTSRDVEAKSHIDAIVSSGQALMTLINDILELTRFESGGPALNPVWLDPRQVIASVRDAFAESVRAKGLSFVMRVAEGIPRAVFIDKARLRQILLNLVGNAVKFTEKGGVELEMSMEASSPTAKTIDLIFIVKDTGIGIEKEYWERIFESFRQRDGRASRRYSGSGLGLTITLRLAEMMNGAISVWSEVGEGSAFTVRLRDVPRENDDVPAVSLPPAELNAFSAPPSCETAIEGPPPVNLGAALSELKIKAFPEWERVRDSYYFDQIEKFARNVAAIGREHGVSPIEEWGRETTRQVVNFEMDRLPETLRCFPELLRDLERWLEAKPEPEVTP